jgi:hypothetical protein
MPLTVFDTKGIPAHRRERIEAAVTAGGKHVRELYEGWIATDPFRGDVRVIITGPHGFERRAGFLLMRIPPKSLAACAKPSMMSSELAECAYRDARAQIGPQPGATKVPEIPARSKHYICNEHHPFSG